MASLRAVRARIKQLCDGGSAPACACSYVTEIETRRAEA